MNRPRYRPAAFLATALAIMLTLGGLASAAQAARCIQDQLPRPSEAPAETRARLEAQGLWQVSAPGDRTPPPNPQVGDTWLWYIWDLSGMPVANLKPCTVRGMGANVYVVIDDDEWNVGIDQAEVDHIVDSFENTSVGNWPTQGIWDLNTSHFGDPPNPLDGLDRVFLLYYRFNIAADGFFWAYDQYPDGSQPWASNEADVVYMAVDNGQPAGNYMLAVAAHEFEHMIHFARDWNEESWLDEGLGELAMWLFGNPDIISSFNTNPDNNLVDFGGAWSDYIQCYLWSLYAYEQLGGQAFIWDLVHSAYNGMSSYAQVMSAHGIPLGTDDLFRDWALANFIDDPSLPDGQYGYTGDTLPPFTAWRTHSTYPAGSTGSVQSWATDYMRCNNPGGVLHLDFNGNDARDFRVAMIGMDATLPTVVEEVPLDALNDGSYDFAAAQGYDEVIVTVANVHSLTGSYTYSVDLVPTAVPGTVPGGPLLAGAYPNPFNPKTTLSYSLDRARALRLVITDTAGRDRRLLLTGWQSAGEHTLDWDGRDAAGRSLPSGVYLARLMGDEGVLDSQKLVLLK